MNIYQVLIRNNKNTGLLDYRKILNDENINLISKTPTDGLCIYIICNNKVIYYLKSKYCWILDILLCSKPIDIPDKQQRKKIIRHLNHVVHPQF